MHLKVEFRNKLQNIIIRITYPIYISFKYWLHKEY
jgi:hypothetical protein